MKHLSKIAIVVCYYGEFPWYFDFYLHSVSFNPSIDVLIITDLEKPNYSPGNVHFIPMSMEEVRVWASNKLGLDVKLDHPYKFCDLKPAYGYIFSELLESYDFWVFGDIDVIYGNIRQFFTEELLSAYDVISVRPEYIAGFFTLCRNIKPVNELFMESKDYKMVFTDSKHYCFDEWCEIIAPFWNNVMGVDMDWKIESMTYLTQKAHEERRIRVLFEFFVNEGRHGHLKWNWGTLSYKRRWEVLLYHLGSFRGRAKIPNRTFHQIPDCYYIRKDKFVFCRS